jgi:two-component system sensor histidine kinase KdpD
MNNARAGWIVVLLLLAATACGLALDRYVSLTSQAMIYVLAVVIASYKLDWVASAICAVFAVTALNFFFVPPRWTLEVENREHFIALAAMLVVALVISRLATGLRRETAVAHRNAQRARQLQTLATDLSDAASAHDIGTLGQDALDSAFDGPCNLVLAQSDGSIPPGCELASGVQDGLRCCMRESAVLGPGTGRWPGLNAWYVPLADQGHILGAAHIQPADSGDDAGRDHAQAVCALLAQALWRLRLTESMRDAQNEAQRQQLQSTFLAAISHDLRTPLAAVVGAASALQTQADKLSPAEKERLLGSIVNEAAYLSTLTENTLQLVRLSSTAQGLRRDWESMEEIVGAVLARVRERDPGRRIQSKVPEGLPLVKADPVLLAQLVGNLLDNALKYSTQTIDLSVRASATELQVAVKDRGPGIPPEQHEAIFQPYARNDHSGQRGAGLGLAVCRAIAQAHGGSLTLRARAGGGSCFTLTLPVDAQPPHKELP